MMTQHLTANEIEQYTENELDAARRAEIEQHLAACAVCRAYIAQGSQLNIALRALPRTQPPRELAARIGGVVETRVAQEQARRARLPFVAIATFFSVLLLLWFCGEMIIAFQENSVLDFFALFTSYPDWYSTDSLDALLALIEALPITEILLTLCALLTVGVLAQQLVDSLHPRAWQFK
jgi:predicted anti-sigma-YlaC factor YlaD